MDMEHDERDRRQVEADYAEAKRRGMFVCGFPKHCTCGGRAYGSPTPNWQNRVVCLSCGAKWSQ